MATETETLVDNLADNITDQSAIVDPNAINGNSPDQGGNPLAPKSTDAPPEEKEDKDKEKEGEETEDKGKDRDKPKKPFMLTFAKEEDAIKAFKEEQKKITKIAQDNARLRGKLEVLEKLQDDTDIDEVDPELQKQRDGEIIAQLESGGSSAILGIIREGLLDVADLNKHEMAKLKQEIIKEIDQRDPELKANADQVKELMEEYGLTSQNALKLAVKMTQDETKRTEEAELERAQIPGRTTATQTGDGTTLSPTQLPAGFEDFLDDCGLNEESKKNIRKGLLDDLAPKE